MFPSSMIVQLASTSTYSQPISAARSTNFFWAEALLGLGWSDHQLQATRPGLIHEVSFTSPGALTSVTSVDSTLAPGESPRMSTRHGISQGRTEEGAAEPKPSPSA